MKREKREKSIHELTLKPGSKEVINNTKLGNEIVDPTISKKTLTFANLQQNYNFDQKGRFFLML